MTLLDAISLQMFQNKMKISYQHFLYFLQSNNRFQKRCTISAMISALVTILHITRVLLGEVKITKVTRGVGFMEPRAGLIFFDIHNCLIVMLSI